MNLSTSPPRQRHNFFPSPSFQAIDPTIKTYFFQRLSAACGKHLLPLPEVEVVVHNSFAGEKVFWFGGWKLLFTKCFLVVGSVMHIGRGWWGMEEGLSIFGIDDTVCICVWSGGKTNFKPRMDNFVCPSR